MQFLIVFYFVANKNIIDVMHVMHVMKFKFDFLEFSSIDTNLD